MRHTDVAAGDADFLSTRLTNRSLIRSLQFVLLFVVAGAHSQLMSNAYASSAFGFHFLFSVCLFGYIVFRLVECRLGQYALFDLADNQGKELLSARERSRLVQAIVGTSQLLTRITGGNARRQSFMNYNLHSCLARIGQGAAVIGILVPLVAYIAGRIDYHDSRYAVASIGLCFCVVLLLRKLLSTRLDFENPEDLRLRFGSERIRISQLESLEIKKDWLWASEFYYLRYKNSYYRLYDPSFDPPFILSLLSGMSGADKSDAWFTA